jgi:hypothetical protein
MFLDSLNEFCDAVSLVRGTGSALIGNTINSQVARDLGNGQPLYLGFTVDTAVDSSGDGASVEFELRSDSSASIDTSSGSLHLSTGAIPEASLTQGATFFYALPVEGIAYEEFLGIVQVTSGEAVTAGKINAFLTCDPHGWKAYPEGQN